MPPPILNDSEDDDEVISTDESERKPSEDMAAEVAGPDGTRDAQSTGSTERLKRQIQLAERELASNSAQSAAQTSSTGASGQASSGSPTVQRNKRRHTAFDPSQSQEKTIKRTKTAKTYSTQQPSLREPREERSFAQFREDDLEGPATSQAKFSEHSAGLLSSAALPMPSLQADFINHEPNVMFNDSGSTIPDGPSSHERMLEQAMRSKPAKSTPAAKLAESDIHQSSPSLWSTYEQVDSGKTNPNETAASEPLPLPEPFVQIQQTCNVDTDVGTAGNTPPAKGALSKEYIRSLGISVGDSQPVMEKSRSSPTVQINIAETASVLPEAKASDNKPKATRGRKRKSLEDNFTDPPNSDDIAVGLPPERYKPRPSRRRATAAEKPIIDYSVVPERAARRKRTKTAAASFESATPETEKASKKKIDVGKLTTAADQSQEPVPQETPKATVEITTKVTADKPQDAVPDETLKLDEQPPTQTSIVSTEQQAPQMLSQKQNDDHIFVKPSIKPKAKPKPASRSRRSHTTIFEDHVEFLGSQRSPSLSQQQASRKEALVDVKNESSPVKPRQRGRKVMADEEDEDELALGNEEAEVDEAEAEEEILPKKRGRGRPARSAAKTAMETEESSPKPVEEATAAQQKTSEPPQKRGRGRPRKASAAAEPDPPADTETAKANAEPDVLPEEDEARPSVEKATEIETEASVPRRASQLATPSPDRLAPPKAKAKEQTPAVGAAKGTPRSHSPIKSSCTVPLRVGLNKKQRIPSLLKVVRGPRKTD